jgi:hypothetical protein
MPLTPLHTGKKLKTPLIWTTSASSIRTTYNLVFYLQAARNGTNVFRNRGRLLRYCRITDSVEIVYRIFLFYFYRKNKIKQNYIHAINIEMFSKLLCSAAKHIHYVYTGPVLVCYRILNWNSTPAPSTTGDRVHNIMYRCSRNENHQTYRVTGLENEYLFIATVMRHVSARLSVPFVHYTE